MLQKKKIIEIILLLILTIGLDQISKFFAFKILFLQNQIIYVNHFLSMRPVWNNGISFGMFQDSGENGKILFTSIAVLISIWLIWSAIKLPKVSSMSYILIAGGALGNAVDRMVHGKVIDFIDLHYLDWHWPTFNIADSFIFIGVVVFLYNELFIIKGKEK
tara:strand:- start:62 stop:544 length:483 start_codon:yes stop_codon:yes gene_type:complete